MKLRLALLSLTALGALTFAAQAEDLKIGLASAQTGTLAFGDQPSLAGLQLAVDEINAAGGFGGKYKAVLDVKDTRSDTAATVQAAQELVASGINILITPCDADPSIAAGQDQPAGQGRDLHFLRHDADHHQRRRRLHVRHLSGRQCAGDGACRLRP